MSERPAWDGVNAASPQAAFPAREVTALSLDRLSNPS